MSIELQSSAENIDFHRHTMYTANNRSSGNVPFLSLKSVCYSLTEGTSIPPAPFQQPAEYTPPQTPPSEKDIAQATSRQYPPLNYYGGPLSSNPVTPVDSNELPGMFEGSRPGSAFFGMSRPGTAYLQTYPNKGFAQPSTTNISPPDSNTPKARDRYYYGNINVNGNGNNPTPPPSFKQPRRPSLARRFLRSLSSTHSLSSKYKDPSPTISSPSQLQQHNGNSTFYYNHTPDSSTRGSLGDRARASNTARGTKRPASRGSIGPECALGSYAEDNVGGGNGNGNGSSFPRMVRKKSMEWFGSAKRKSGIWGGGGGGGDFSMAAMEEQEEEERRREKEKQRERERERARDEDMEAQMVMEEKRKRETLLMEPPPVLPEFGKGLNGGSLGGGQMFEGIGR